MTDLRKQKLIDLDTEALADALLSLAVHSEEADELIEQLIATPRENVLRFKRKLSGLKRRRRFIDWRGVPGFARELEMLLQDLKSGVDDPLTGVELLAAFYEADGSIFEMCDDSNGYIGDMFRYAAKELFVDYASRCADKKKVADIVLKVNRKDDYGIRDTLIYCAGEFLPEELIRSMIQTLQKWADNENDKYEKKYYLMLIESLARQVKDAELFEKTRIASWGKLSAAALIDIARVYLESGDVETAHSRMKQIPQDDTYKAHEQDQLLTEIYRNQGDCEKLTNLLYKQFRTYHSTDTLTALLDVIGHDQRDQVLADAAAQILKSDRLDEPDADFLIAVGKVDQAEMYLLKHADQLDGDCYYSLLPLGEAMEAEKRYLVTSLIFRSLLVSILERGYTKAYPHGARYLRKLDKLSKAVSDWKTFPSHELFKQQIIQKHGRKKSFWAKYKS